MKSVLRRDFAESRRKQLGNVSYDLFLRFEPKAETYNGVCNIKFFLKDKAKGVYFESISNIKKILVNGKEVNYGRERNFVILKEGLEEGCENQVEIEYKSKYNKTGEGLHQFVDSEDGSEYIYSDFEPYDAHLMFPCFDQPNIKATLKLTVEIPEKWEAISNEEVSDEKKEGDKRIVSFKETKKLSTYLFHVSLGNYEYVEDSHKGINMRVYFRKTMEKYVPKEDMFTLTKQGLDFYSDFFNYPYPFSKYDQLFVPEFNSGAMENPGAITFSEHHLVRRKPTRTDRAILANTLIHEMAHMWFGDLVTMKWWDDLWLNESFADFMAYFTMVQATEFKDAWEDFHARKAWAYHQDQLSTTHPIAANAEDTDIAFSNFDGISYAKGASVLKQLLFYIGEENFKKGIRDYFKKYEWSNTELNDFLECLEKACNQDLKGWFDVWIKTTGVNTIFPQPEISEKNLSGVKIIQKPSKRNNLLRNHKTKIALFYNINGKIIPKEIKEVSYQGAETNIGLNVPTENLRFIFLNHEDWDYVKNSFDKVSIENVLEVLGKVEDSLSKHMIYGSLWEMVKDAELDPKKFLELIIKNAPNEENLLLLERLVLRAKASLVYYVNDENFKIYSDRLFDLALDMMNSDIDQDRKGVWFRLLNFAVTGTDKSKSETLIKMLRNDVSFKNFELDQDKRWSSIAVLNSIGHEHAENLLEEEARIDKSDRGQKRAAFARVSHIKNKKEFWNLFLSGEGKSSDYIKDAMGGFFWRHQKEETREYVDHFLNNVTALFEKHDKHYLRHFFVDLFPSIYVEEDLLDKIKKQVDSFQEPETPKLLTKYMKEGIDNLERAIKIIKKSA